VIAFDSSFTTMNVRGVVTRVFTKIKSECPRKLKELKTKCEEVIGT